MSGESCTHLTLPVTQQALRDMIENVPGMIYQFVLYSDGQVVFPYVSRGCQEIFGCSPEEIISDSSIALDAVHPHDTPLLHAMIAESADNPLRVSMDRAHSPPQWGIPLDQSLIAAGKTAQ